MKNSATQGKAEVENWIQHADINLRLGGQLEQKKPRTYWHTRPTSLEGLTMSDQYLGRNMFLFLG